MISRTHESNHHPCAIALRNVVRNPFAWPRFLLGTVLVICVIQIPSLASQAFADGVAKLNRQARAAIAAEHWEVAAASYEKAIQLAPKTAKLRVKLGMLLTKLGRLPDAIVMYQEALRIAPQNMPAEIGLAQAYRGVPKFEEPSRPRAYLSSLCQQSADRLAPRHAGLDHRTTLPTTLPPPWQTSDAQQCPAAAPPVAQSFPPV
jgi:tetratricopeptide (TPR) repeat protein